MMNTILLKKSQTVSLYKSGRYINLQEEKSHGIQFSSELIKSHCF